VLLPVPQKRLQECEEEAIAQGKQEWDSLTKRGAQTAGENGAEVRARVMGDQPRRCFLENVLKRALKQHRARQSKTR